MTKKLCAEAVGTFWLVFAGCGSAVLASAFGGSDSHLGIGFAGVALAFGLSVLTMAFAIGHISGCHLNPAVTLGLVAGGRHPAKEAVAYIGAQTFGAIVAAAVLYAIATGRADADIGNFAANGYGAHSPGQYGLAAAALTEFVLTAIFLLVIMGSTDARAPAGLAPIAIGLCLTLIHLIGIPVTNVSVNPARSTGPALFVGGWALEQLWLFWVVPSAGAVAGSLLYRGLFADKSAASVIAPAHADRAHARGAHAH